MFAALGDETEGYTTGIGRAARDPVTWLFPCRGSPQHIYLSGVGWQYQCCRGTTQMHQELHVRPFRVPTGRVPALPLVGSTRRIVIAHGGHDLLLREVPV